MEISTQTQDIKKGDALPLSWWRQILLTPVLLFKKFDQKMDGAASFFIRHFGKTKFMLTMSKKARVLGLEKLFLMGPKAFLYFFLFYLVRDVILYILIPIGIARWTD